MRKKVCEIMTNEVFTLSQNDTILKAAKLMKEKDIGFIPILEDNQLLGVITDRDLIIRGYALGKPAETPLKDVMTHSCITIEEDVYIDEAAEIMAKNQIRRLCICNQGQLTGICAIGDLSVSNAGMTNAGIALSKISESNNYNSY